MTEQLKLAPVNSAAFRNNDGIKGIAKIPMWTVSDENKRPLNAKDLLQLGPDGEYAGLYKRDRMLVTLADLDKDPYLSDTNRAYRLNSQRDNMLLIDLEPVAEQSTIDALCKLPVIYAENSMHGGYHMLLPIPPQLVTKDNEYIFNLTALKGPKKEFELLLNHHFVTFTRRVIKTPTHDYRNPKVIKMIENFLNSVVKYDAATERSRRERIQNKIGKIDVPTNVDSTQKKQLSEYDKALKRLSKTITLDKYDNDLSRYEFAMAGRCLYLASESVAETIPDNPFSGSNQNLKQQETDKVMKLAYLMLKSVLPYREKHDTKRNGMPWLMYELTESAKSGTSIKDGKVKGTLNRKFHS